jgi:hypothetical protein
MPALSIMSNISSVQEIRQLLFETKASCIFRKGLQISGLAGFGQQRVVVGRGQNRSMPHELSRTEGRQHI